MRNRALIRIIVIALCAILVQGSLPYGQMAMGAQAPKAVIRPTAAVNAGQAVNPAVTARPVKTAKPKASAVVKPTPTAQPVSATVKPSATVTPAVTATPAPLISVEPTASTSATPSAAPSVAPSATASATPSATATVEPTPEQTGSEAQIPLGFSEVLVQQQLEQQSNNAKRLFEEVAVNAEHYVDFSFGSVKALKGIFSKLQLYARILDYCEVTSATLMVSYVSSDLILEEYSSLTFYMNGVPFYSCKITGDGITPTVLYVSVPLELLQDGYNLLEIGGYVRLTDDEGCSDDYNGANWVNIGEATRLRVGYNLLDDNNLLSYFPYPFISLANEAGADVTVAVSDAMLNEELTAAMMVMADLGAEVSASDEIQFAKISEAGSDHVIYFGTESNTPASLLAHMNQAIPPKGALIQRSEVDGKEYLLVIANQPEALIEAARLIGDTNRISQIKSSHTNVSVGESDIYIANLRNIGLLADGQYTFKDFVGHGVAFTGPFHQEATLYLPVSEDYTLSAKSRFSLNIRYSENLDFDRSAMSVYWGDVPIMSRKLTRENAAGETVTFSVPADAVGTAGTYIKIAFELEVKELDCTPRQLDMPWAYVAENSYVYLPQGDFAQLNLGNLPAPFQRNGRLNDVLVVLPDDPKASELLLAARTICMLGNGSDPYGELKVIRERDFSQQDSDYNIVVIGLGARNAMTDLIGDQLHFSFSADHTAFESNDKLILSEEYAKSIGVVQIIQSPFAEGRALLALLTPNERGLSALTQMISREKLRWSLEKEAVIIDEDLNTASYQFTANTVIQEERPSLLEAITQNKEPMLFTLVGLGSMLILLVGALLVLINIRNRRKNEE